MNEPTNSDSLGEYIGEMKMILEHCCSIQSSMDGHADSVHFNDIDKFDRRVKIYGLILEAIRQVMRELKRLGVEE